MGTFQMSRAAHPHLKQHGGGVIVNISATLHYGATFYQVPWHLTSTSGSPMNSFRLHNTVSCPAVKQFLSLTHHNQLSSNQQCFGRDVLHWNVGVNYSLQNRCTCRRPRRAWTR